MAITWAVLFLTMAGPAPTPAMADAPALHRDVQGCRMVVPADLGRGAIRWVGACGDGVANGAGVMRVDRGGGDVALFAGVMRAGRPVAGWLDTGSAETAGPSLRFNGADGLPTVNRVESQRACATAATGADAASARLRAAGNTASARFYAGWARTLRRCLDKPE